MISMRYAANLAAGAGLVWNPGERVEGYTNFLWTLLMAVAARARPEPRRARHPGGRRGGTARGGVGLPPAAAAVSPGDAVAPTVAFGFALFHYPLAFWTLLGMETGLVLMLSALAMVAALTCDRQPRASPPWS
jgi:hypothetical protein